MPDQLCESVGIDGNSGVDLETGSSGEKFDEVLAPPARWQERRGWGKQKKKPHEMTLEDSQSCSMEEERGAEGEADGMGWGVGGFKRKGWKTSWWATLVAVGQPNWSRAKYPVEKDEEREREIERERRASRRQPASTSRRKGATQGMEPESETHATRWWPFRRSTPFPTDLWGASSCFWIPDGGFSDVEEEEEEEEEEEGCFTFLFVAEDEVYPLVKLARYNLRF